MTRKWKALYAVVIALAALLAVSAAFAANQIKGGSYKGSLTPANNGVTVSFKVSSSGEQVSALTVSNTPIYCGGGGRPTPVHFKNASIASNGTFVSTGQYVITEGPKKGKVGTKLKITGRFLKGKGAYGTLATTYVGSPTCGGKSTYFATA